MTYREYAKIKVPTRKDYSIDQKVSKIFDPDSEMIYVRMCFTHNLYRINNCMLYSYFSSHDTVEVIEGNTVVKKYELDY
jgi:hypothetical protein